MAHHDAQEKTG